ncbi:unnamed protein product [Allacma fusca]|uniref:Glutamyl-tRNA(Gln) amidotransferase subunit C, mitochondrial n=1 Tax=Allacma fusca TaxID=39272 RepID=A0A8J2PZH2_9HEXA|nr:unnamed protein product [Allacma fusca]
MWLNPVITSGLKIVANSYCRSYFWTTPCISNLLGRISNKFNNYSSSAISDDSDHGQNEGRLTRPVKFHPELISHLERTSLVGFGSEEAVLRLEEAIKFASVLNDVNTAGVKPMDSVLENETLYLREDETSETSRKDILSNAAITDEDYFVAPPGNIPLEASKLAQDLVKTRA